MAFHHPPLEAERARVEDGDAVRGLPVERLHPRDSQARRAAVRGADDVEARAGRAGVAAADHPRLRQVLRQVRVPGLHAAERVVLRHAVVVRRLVGGRGAEHVGDDERRQRAADHRVALREGGLAGELARDGRVRARVVADAVAAAEDETGLEAIRRAQARRDVVEVGPDQAGGEGAGERSGRAGEHRGRGAEVRRHVEVRKMAVGLRERIDQFVAKAQGQRQLRALAPVVLEEEAGRLAAQLHVPRSVLERALLRQAEQEIGEVRAGHLPGQPPCCTGR